MEGQTSQIENVTESIENLKNEVVKEKKEDNKDIKAALGVVDVAQSIVDNWSKFTSGDPLEITSGAIGIIGAVAGAVGGPIGLLVSGICGLVSAFLSIFGGNKGPSLGEVVDKVIRRALEDFQDESIHAQVIGSLKETTAHIANLNGIASYNDGQMTDVEKSFLTTMDFSTVGVETLGELQGQLDKYKLATKDPKASRVVNYCYYYCMISVLKRIILTLQCSLLRKNGMESIHAGAANYLYNTLPKEDQKVLGFLSELPDQPNNHWWSLYTRLHSDLSQSQRAIIAGYLKQIGLEMKGQLCRIYNTDDEAYICQADLCYNDQRRLIFTVEYDGSNYCNYLLRRVGPLENCALYSVQYCEYLYPESGTVDNEIRFVFSWRTGEMIPEGYWNATDSSIKSIARDEYIYSRYMSVNIPPGRDVSASYIVTRIGGSDPQQGAWTIKDLNFDDDFENLQI